MPWLALAVAAVGLSSCPSAVAAGSPALRPVALISRRAGGADARRARGAAERGAQPEIVQATVPIPPESALILAKESKPESEPKGAKAEESEPEVEPKGADKYGYTCMYISIVLFVTCCCCGPAAQFLAHKHASAEHKAEEAATAQARSNARVRRAGFQDKAPSAIEQPKAWHAYTAYALSAAAVLIPIAVFCYVAFFSSILLEFWKGGFTAVGTWCGTLCIWAVLACCCGSLQACFMFVMARGFNLLLNGRVGARGVHGPARE